jgi:hypothetical protein
MYEGWNRMRASRTLILLAVVLLAVVLPGAAVRAEELLPSDPKVILHLPAETLNGMIGAELEILESGEYRLAAQLGRPGDYPNKQSIRSVKTESTGRQIIHFDTKGYKDGVWTLFAEKKNGQDWVTHDYAIVVMDNRPGVPLTQPGEATGKITVVPTATGTVGVRVTVDEKAVEWTLRKQSATSANTKTWESMTSSALRDQTYHWYTRSESNGQYTLRLEVYDANKHSQYFDVTVTVDNRAGLPQTEPGTAQAELNLPEIVSNVLPIDLNFRGTVRYWRLTYININPTNARSSSIGSGTMGTAETVYWKTSDASDGTYVVTLEVEDENRHVYQTSTTTTVANKVTTTLQQPIGANEEHQFVIAVAGGLTSFRLGSTPLGYYQLTVSDSSGKVLATERTHPLNQPLQSDLPMGSYRLSVKSLFVMPGAKYTVEMKGATAWTIPLAKMATALPVTLRQTSSVPMLVAQGSPKPAAAGWFVDGGSPTTIANPDGTVDVDTRKLGDGQHTITFRSSNAVGFVTETSFPFVVDNQQSFSDVPDTHLARWAVELLKDARVTNGYEDGTFKPANTITRAEFAKMLSVAMGLAVEKPYSGAFRDVATGDWFAPYVEAVYGAGIIKGYETAAGLEFKPGAPVTRAEMMVMLLRAADVPEVLAAQASASLGNPDWRTVADWAKPSMVVGVKLGLLNERYGRTLAPAAPAERGEVALALGRMLLAGQLGK